MTSELRHQLHELVDNAPTVDVIDRALGGAHAMRRRRQGVGVGLAVVVAAAAPFALGGTGARSPSLSIQASGNPTAQNPSCGQTPQVYTRPSSLDEIEPVVQSHLPGVTLRRGGAAYEAGSCAISLLTLLTSTTGDGQLWIYLVGDVADIPGLSYPAGATITSTSCDGLLDAQPPPPEPSLVPSGPDSGSPAPPSGPDGGSPALPSGSDGSSPPPSGITSEGPSALPGIIDESPAMLGLISPQPSDVPELLFCDAGTPTTPMVFGVADGPVLTVGEVYADHRAVIARAFNPVATATNPAPSALTVEQLRAIAADERLTSMIPTR